MNEEESYGDGYQNNSGLRTTRGKLENSNCHHTLKISKEDTFDVVNEKIESAQEEMRQLKGCKQKCVQKKPTYLFGFYWSSEKNLSKIRKTGSGRANF